MVDDDDFRYSCSTLSAAYKPPSVPTLSGPLLDQQYNAYKCLINPALKRAAGQGDLVIGEDGWTGR